METIGTPVRPGEMLALMGPSGSGKTTLLSALAGRLPLHSGRITLGDQPLGKAARRRICYVTQQDLFFSNLTLRDTLWYQAQLKLPSSLSAAEKEAVVSALAQELDIAKCYDTVMGGDEAKGLSGGERKRANIVCELLSNPVLMLLDEPTSGLDSSTAHSLCLTLRRYAERHHKTVVTSIHQPSSSTYRLFDKILLVAEGQIAFYGRAFDVVEYFASIGFRCSPNYNPADFVLDKLKESPEVTQRIIRAAEEMRTHCQECPLESNDPGIPDENYPNGSVMDALREFRLRNKGPQGSLGDDGPRWPSNFGTQYVTLLSRHMRHRRPIILSWLSLVQSLAVALMAGIIWWRLPRVEEQVHARTGMLYFTLLHWMFTVIFETLTSFPMERPVINKERLSGTFRLSAYYLAKVTGELPLVVIQPLVSVTIILSMAGVSGAAGFFTHLAVVIFGTLTAQSIGLFLSASFLRIDQSLTAATIVLLAVLLLGGFYIQQLPPWFFWARYLSLATFAFSIMLSAEFADDHTFLCKPLSSAFQHCNQMRNLTNGTLFIPRQDILDIYSTNLPTWANLLALLLFFLTFHLATYLALRTFRKP